MVTKSNANRELECEGMNGISNIRCEQDRYDESLLKIEMKAVTQQTGLFKISLSSIRNALSLRGSSIFGEIT